MGQRPARYWERGWSFIKRAGTVILAATIILWFLQGFGFENGAFTMVEDQDNSILAIVASAISATSGQISSPLSDSSSA